MINYSVSKRKVMGQENGVERAYACAQSDNVMDIEKFAEHIASHGSIYSEDIIEGVLKKAVKCMVEKLKEGYKINLGAMGTYYVTIVNKGWQSLPEQPKDFNPSIHIEGLKVVWERSEKMLRIGDDAQYNPVATRAAQAATLKAEKDGQSTVDLAAAKNKGAADSDDNSGYDEIEP